LKLNTLSIRNLRNISTADIQFSPTLNFFNGNNGAGKSSIIEAIYLLARAKSFRQANNKSLIRYGTEELMLYTEVQQEGNRLDKIGLRKQGSKTEIKLNGGHLTKLSDLVTTLTVSLITPQTHRIIEEGPENRRRLLNWGVFHVEHQYKNSILRFNRILSQRNSLLKSNSKDISVWDMQLSQYADEINAQHKKYLKYWYSTVKELSRGISFLNTLKMSYSPGWDTSHSLLDILKEKIDIDRKRGYTTTGPHRADISITLNDRPAKEVLSRGQQKLLMIILLVSQSKILEKAAGEKAVILIDDLHSELDKESQEIILGKLENEKCQTVITSINSNRQLKNIDSLSAHMFHVEHGEVRQTD
jgi:DNA replication and repair protein RecF